MDFSTDTSLIERATKHFADADPGDTVVVIASFFVDGTLVPRGAFGTFVEGNFVKVDNYDNVFALDGYDYYLRAVPNALDYPPGHESQPVGNVEPDMVPDVIERSAVERVIRQFADDMGYPQYAQRLIDQLPRQERQFVMVVSVGLAATDEDEAASKVREALEVAGLDFQCWTDQ